MARSAALAALLTATWLAAPHGAAAPPGDAAASGAGASEDVPAVTGLVVPPPSASSATAAREARWTAGLAQLYGSPVALVVSLRALGLDHVETECAVAVSTRAQRPVGEVLELRKAGMDWGEIARAYGFSLLEAIRETPAGRRRSARPSQGRSRP